jgi:hypothetical protein
MKNRIFTIFGASALAMNVRTKGATALAAVG